MKKIIIYLLFAPLFASAQNIDTVLIRNLTLQLQDVAWLVSQTAGSSDSLTIVTVRKIRAKVQAVQNPTWATSITLDSLPGKIVLQMYHVTIYAAASEIVNRYTAIKNAISAKTNLAYWIGFADSRMVAEFDRKRNIGKNILIDQ